MSSNYLSRGGKTSRKVKHKTLRPLTHKVDERVPIKTLLKGLYACWYYNSIIEASRKTKMNYYRLIRHLHFLEKEFGVIVFERRMKQEFSITDDGLALIARYIKWGKSPLLMKGC